MKRRRPTWQPEQINALNLYAVRSRQLDETMVEWYHPDHGAESLGPFLIEQIAKNGLDDWLDAHLPFQFEIPHPNITRRAIIREALKGQVRGLWTFIPSKDSIGFENETDAVFAKLCIG